MFSYGFLIDFQLSIVALWLVYYLVIHRRVSAKIARYIILFIIPAALLISTVKIPVFKHTIYVTQSPSVIKDAARQVDDKQHSTITDNSNNGYHVSALDEASLITNPAILKPLATQQSNISWIEALAFLYLGGVVSLSLWTLLGMARITIFIARAKKETVYGRIVIFTNDNISAYSFFRYIVVNQKYRNSSTLRSVIMHESYHTSCHHTFDLLYMILMRILLWFNPVSWHLMNLIRQIHEYEVDRKVVESGEPLADYMSLLINAGYAKAPVASHSLSYSLTKKRLNMITKHYSKFSSMRIVAVAPVTALLICAFVLTANAEIINNEPKVESTDLVTYSEAKSITEPSAEQATAETVLEAESAVVVDSASSELFAVVTEKELIDMNNTTAAKDAPAAESVARKSVEPIQPQASSYSIMHTTYLPAEDNLPAVVLNYDEKEFPKIFRSVTGKELDRRWVASINPEYISSVVLLPDAMKGKDKPVKFKNENAILVNIKSGVSYYKLCESVMAEGGQSYRFLPNSKSPQVRALIFLEQADGKIMKMRFPYSDLYEGFAGSINKDYVANMSVIEPAKAVNRFGVAGINGVVHIKLKPVQGGLNTVIQTRGYSEDNQPIRIADRYDVYRLTNDQIKVARNRASGYSVSRVRFTDNETIVTMALPIGWDEQWHAPNSSYVLEDVASKDRYYFRRVNGGIPKDKLLLITGYNGKTIELDYVFPRLKDGVEEVVMYSPSPSNYEIPRNAAAPHRFKIKISDYINKKTGEDIY